MKDVDVLSFLFAVQQLRKPEYDSGTCLPKPDAELASAVRAMQR